MCTKIKAEASSSGASITNVEFLVDQTNSVGIVTNPPFTHVWNGVITNSIYDDFIVLTAVARDSAGMSATSAPVTVYLVLGPPYSILDLTSPTNGTVFATSDSIQLSAELLASPCATGPEEFFVGTNWVGILNTNGSNEAFTDSTPLFSLTVSNLAEGDYEIGVRYLGLGYCTCGTASIRVVKLGLMSPRFGIDRKFTFQVVTSFAGREHEIEVSTNLLNWTAASTNQPSVSSFTFADSSPPTGFARFYRVSVPSQ